jgi:hypothetical protein
MQMTDPSLGPLSQEDEAEFERRLAAARVDEESVPVVEVGGHPVAWAPQEGSQTTFMDCPIQEVLYHGTRGPGKTDALLMDFAQHVGKGHGAAWAGVLFRQSYPQLADVQAKSEKWFRRMFPGAKFNQTKMQWTFPDGERLLLRHMSKASDYYNYHGHEYPWIGWEELSNWPDDTCFKAMFSCNRCSTPGVPRKIRATTNPYGPGHSWIKDRYRLEGQWWRTIIIDDAKDAEGRPEPPRVAIHGHIDENLILLRADPDYKRTIIASAANPEMAKAWLSGSWDIASGGMFGDVWDGKVNIIPPFVIPQGWRIDRSFDWGSSKPFSVGWWAESDGSDVRMADGRIRSTIRGDLFRVAEWYGWTGKPNEGLRMLARDIARGIVQREIKWGWRDLAGNCRVRAGPADTQIFDVENGNSVSADMGRRVKLEDGRTYKGISWTRADKSQGSRKNGWEQMRTAMRNAKPLVAADGTVLPREEPGLFVFDTCRQFIRTVPNIPRSEKDLDDVDSDAEDHVADEARYRVRQMNLRTRGSHVIGMH